VTGDGDICEDDRDNPTLRCRVPTATPLTPVLDWLTRRFTYLTAAAWRDAIANGRVRRNDAVAQLQDVVGGGDLVSVRTAPDELHVEILFEDERCVVVDKPAGSVVHAASAFTGRTFLRGLAARVGVAELHCVHRLDRDTSGALLLAKDAATMADLQAQFATRAVTKSYLALTHGAWERDAVRVDAPLGPAAGSRVRTRRAVVAPGGRGAQPASTDFAVLLRAAHHTLVLATPHTGRTHQIRAHLEHLGHALVGDKLYGRSDEAHLADLDALRRGASPWAASTGCPHHLLHAAALTFTPPGAGGPRTVRAPLPEHFAAFLAQLRPDPGPPVQGRDS